METGVPLIPIIAGQEDGAHGAMPASIIHWAGCRQTVNNTYIERYARTVLELQNNGTDSFSHLAYPTHDVRLIAVETLTLQAASVPGTPRCSLAPEIRGTLHMLRTTA